MYIILVLIVGFVTVVLYRTAKFKPLETKNEREQYIDNSIDIEKSQNNLSDAIKIKTISNTDYDKFDYEKFEQFITFLEKTYPKTHKKLDRQRINKYSLVYKWTGKNNSKKPILLMGHYDVVPVERGTEDDWIFDAFSGEIVGDKIWGRGTLDDKISVISILEAAEYLLEEDYMPERDIYFSFGHDEEVGGEEGASKVAEKFEKENLEFEFVIDEGGAVVEKPMKGIDKTVAMIGICEKGSTNVKITVRGEGGHSSTPPKNTALGKLAIVLTRLENSNMKPKITDPLNCFLSIIGREMGFVSRLAIANMGILRPLLLKIFENNPTTNAFIRTTIALTMSEASDAPNVLPQKASAVVNCRIRPGDTVDDLMDHINKVAGNIEIETEILMREEASSVTDINSSSYKKISKTIKKIYPEALISPYLMVGGTDSRKYEKVSENIIRFAPYRISNTELSSIHNTNENISIDNLRRYITFMKLIMKIN